MAELGDSRRELVILSFSFSLLSWDLIGLLRNDLDRDLFVSRLLALLRIPLSLPLREFSSTELPRLLAAG